MKHDMKKTTAANNSEMNQGVSNNRQNKVKQKKKIKNIYRNVTIK